MRKTRHRTRTRQAVRDHAVSAAWGAAEGTVFFIVPDVWISWVALRSPRRSLATTVSALVGALAGGTLTHVWGARTSAVGSRELLVRVPAISSSMVEQVEAEVARDGGPAMMAGPLRGVPYKIYARTSGLQGRSVAGFLAWSVPARMIRFLLVAIGASALAGAGRRLLPEQLDSVAPVAFVTSWTAFYAWFFNTVGRD